MEYINRIYRSHFQQERWHFFGVQYKESDLYIGVEKNSWHPQMPIFANQQLQALRQEMDHWIIQHPEYAQALKPINIPQNGPLIFQEMAQVALLTGIGPMSAIAGAVAEHIGKAIKKQFNVVEILVENGGDIYADIQQELDVSVFAGRSPLSEKVGLSIPATYSSLGICTSSGTIGPSLSFGKADAVMIVCQDVKLADSYATAFANQIQTVNDIPDCIHRIQTCPQIIAAIAIKDDKMGIHSPFGLKLF